MHRKSLISAAWIISATLAQASTPRTEQFNRLPLRFEDYSGEVPGARYAARGANFTLYLSARENRLDWSQPGGKGSAQLRTALVNANRGARPEPGDRLAGEANYFVGPAAHWRTGVVGYENIRYREVYAGIDLIFHGEQKRLEYDFVLAPHADPRAIRLELSGQRGLRIDADGDLVIETAAGPIRWKRPEIYQEAGGRRAPVAGSFVLAGNRRVAFRIGKYDRELPLTIDPTLAYSTFLGGNHNEYARGIGVDAAGNVYLAGGTSTANLPTTAAAVQPSFGGQTSNPASGDAFVAKFSPAGALLYLTYLGGSGDDTAMGLAVDAAGNAYITGFTTSTNFPVTATPVQQNFAGLGGNAVMTTGDAFVTKLAPTGNKLIYSTYLGGTKDDFGMAIAIDGTGAAYITGGTISSNFPVTSSAYQRTYKGSGGQQSTFTFGVPLIDSGDAFVAKIDPTGSILVFSTYLGGTKDDVGSAIAQDSSGVYVAGFTLSSTFPTTAGALQQTFGGADTANAFFQTGDGFIAKLKPDGSSLIYSTLFGGPGDDYVQGLAVDNSGNLYFTGSSGSKNLPTTAGVFQPSQGGPPGLPSGTEDDIGDAFVGKLNPAGSALVYLTYLGGSLNDSATSIAIDSAGNAYVGGFTDSTDFPLSNGAIQTKMGGDGGSVLFLNFGDAFLSVLDPKGAKLLYSTYLGGNKDDLVFGLALDATGNIYLAGNTFSTNFTVTGNAAQKSFGGAQQIYTFPWGDAFYATFSSLSATIPTINNVSNAESGVAVIAANTWTAIYGTDLAGTSRSWLASDFVNNNMPTTLSGVSVTMNGVNAYVYYISATQLGVLTPPGLTAGPVQVQVTNGGVTSPPFTAQAQALSPAFFVFGGTPYILATHADNSLIGPATLYPGVTTPAQAGETIVAYAEGFGPTSVPVVAGVNAQSGVLTPFPVILVGGVQANVTFAGLVTPGLYQFNFIIPTGLGSGDVSVTASMSGFTTAAGLKITLQ